MLDAPQLDAQALARLNLNIQPFLPPRHCEEYFVPTALGMLINGVFQQLSNHDGIQVIKGESGSGKTSFCRRLLCDVPPGFSIDLHSGSGGQTINTLLETIAGLSEPTQAGTQELAVQAANRVFRRLLDQQQPALVIDDAHLLPPKTLQTLLKFLSAIAKQNYGRLKLVLVGERKVDETLARINPALLSPADIFSALLRPLNRQDVEHYIRFRLERAGATQPMPLTQKELASIQSRCAGLPYKINRLTCEVLNKRNGGFTGGKSFRNLFLGFAVLSVALALLIYRSAGNNDPPATTSTAMTKSAALPRKNNAPAIKTPDTPSVVTTLPRNSTDNIVMPALHTVESREPAILTGYPQSNEAESAGSSAEPSEPGVANNSGEPEATTARPDPAAGNIIEYAYSESWLASQPDAYLMVQLAGTWNLESLQAFSRRLHVNKTLVFHRSLRNNQEWFVLLYGPFPDYSAAEQGILELPPNVQSNNPWIRSVASFKKTL